MSIYCTLPRRHPFTGINQRRNTMVSAEEARKLVDDLFNPIVQYECDDTNEQNYDNPYDSRSSVAANQDSVYGSYGSNYCQTNNYTDSLHMQKHLSTVSESSRLSTASSLGAVVATRINTNQTSNISNKSSNINNNMPDGNQNAETSCNSSAKLYYAFDNFEDFRRRRRSLAPDFYGGGLTASLYGTDSAYESSSPSYESLKSDSDPKFKRKSKYFTLPTRRSSAKNRLKDNVHDIAKRFVTNASNAKNVTNNAFIANTNTECNANAIPDNNYSNYSSAQSLLTNKVNANQAQNGNYVTKNSVSHREFHCCCRSGCHMNNSVHSNRQNQANSGGFGLHCCQQMLETLWEEPTIEASNLAKNRRSIANSVNPTNPGNGSNKLIEVSLIYPFDVYCAPMNILLQTNLSPKR